MLLFFVERGKASKVLTSTHFRAFYRFYRLYLECMQDFPRNMFTERASQSSIFGKYLDNNYCDNFRSSAKKLSSIFQWSALMYWKFKNLKIMLTVGSWSLPVTPSICVWSMNIKSAAAVLVNLPLKFWDQDISILFVLLIFEEMHK